MKIVREGSTEFEFSEKFEGAIMIRNVESGDRCQVSADSLLKFVAEQFVLPGLTHRLAAVAPRELLLRRMPSIPTNAVKD